MAILSFNARAAGSGSGAVYKQADDTWANVRNAATGTTVVAGTNVVGQQSGANYRIDRAFLSFDTSSLPNNATVTNTTITASWSVSNGDNDGSDYLVAVQSTQASATTLATSDYSKVSNTKLSNSLDMTGLSGTQTLTLNSTGIATISLTGNTLFAIREGHDIDNAAIADSTTNQVGLSSIKLNVTYTRPDDGTQGFFNV